jgi:large subunit ribosomal protein L54
MSFVRFCLCCFLSPSLSHPLNPPSNHPLTPTLPHTAKSKKQRRLALKRKRTQEARLLASGDLEALVPKIPLQKQTVNLPGAEPGNVGQAVEAVDKREELRRAMRKERRAGIKESNYLKAM